MGLQGKFTEVGTINRAIKRPIIVLRQAHVSYLSTKSPIAAMTKKFPQY